MNKKLVVDLLKNLKKAADPVKAPQMQSYMKSAMPYLGIQTPMRRQLFRHTVQGVSFKSAKDWESTARELWDKARFREERYCAIELTQLKCARDFQTLSSLKLYEHMIVTGAWWDYVDSLATQNIGGLLKKYPSAMAPRLLRWSRSSNLWKRRTAILAQLNFKSETNLELLYACIRPSLGSNEFFLQKAIGWALRQYARTNPQEVKRYVEKHSAELSNLSRREAMKRVVAD